MLNFVCVFFFFLFGVSVLCCCIFILTHSFLWPAWFYKPITDLLFRQLLLLFRWFYRFLKPRLQKFFYHPRVQAVVHFCLDLLVIIFYKLYGFFSRLDLYRLQFIQYRFRKYNTFDYLLFLFKWRLLRAYFFLKKARLLVKQTSRSAFVILRLDYFSGVWPVHYPFGYLIWLLKDVGNPAAEPWNFWQFTHKFGVLIVCFFFSYQFIGFIFNWLSYFFFFFSLPFNEAFFVVFFSFCGILFGLWFVYSLCRMGFFIFLRLLRRRRREVNFFYFCICFFIILALLVVFFYAFFFGSFVDFCFSNERLFGQPCILRPIICSFSVLFVLDIYSYIAYRCYNMECWLSFLESGEPYIK